MVRALIGRYQRAKSLAIDVVDLDIPSLAGYYLCEYPGDPINALLVDVAELRVASTVALPAKIMLAGVLQREGYNHA